MPKKVTIRHETLLNMKNAASLSNEKMRKMLHFVREDVPAEPRAGECHGQADHVKK
jgi:hypothetical protein